MEKLRTAFLISGEGTTMQAVIRSCQDGGLPRVEPVVVIASRHDAGGIAKARVLDIPVSVLQRKDYGNNEAFGEALLAVLREHHVDLVSQNGWLPLTPANVVEVYRDRIINQHPGPLDNGRPDFGGRGMYGKRVTCARIAYLWVTGEDQWTESTVHMVTAEYDRGDVLSASQLHFGQPKEPISFAVLREDVSAFCIAVEQVSRDLLGLEHQNVIDTLGLLSLGDAPRVIRKEPLIPSEQYTILNEAKSLAVQLYPNG